jgi:hypothetical protein
MAWIVSVPFRVLHLDSSKGKGKFHPRTGHEGPEGAVGSGIALLFL